MNAVPTIALNDGHAIPQLGFGVFQIDPAETAQAVRQAFDIGYRHVDTAEMYRNEKGVGEAVAASGLNRSDVFVTSKLNNGYHRPDDARRAFDESLAALGFDYLDLFLIHWPLPTRYDGDFVSTWTTLDRVRRATAGPGRSASPTSSRAAPRAAGRRDRHVVPVVNQIEVHPYLTNEAVRTYDAAARHPDRGLVADRPGRCARRTR